MAEKDLTKKFHKLAREYSPRMLGQSGRRTRGCALPFLRCLDSPHDCVVSLHLNKGVHA